MRQGYDVPILQAKNLKTHSWGGQKFRSFPPMSYSGLGVLQENRLFSTRNPKCALAGDGQQPLGFLSFLVDELESFLAQFLVGVDGREDLIVAFHAEPLLLNHLFHL